MANPPFRPLLTFTKNLLSIKVESYSRGSSSKRRDDEEEEEEVEVGGNIQNRIMHPQK
jgi:hypothetical protein